MPNLKGNEKLWEIPCPLVRIIAESVFSQLKAGIEVIPLVDGGPVPEHAPEKLRIYLLVGEGVYSLYFFDAGGKPQVFFVHTRTTMVDSRVIVNVAKFGFGSGSSYVDPIWLSVQRIEINSAKLVVHDVNRGTLTLTQGYMAFTSR